MHLSDLQHRPHLLELLKQSKGVRKKQLSEEIEKATGTPPNAKLLTVLLRVREEEGEGEGGREGESIHTNKWHLPILVFHKPSTCQTLGVGCVSCLCVQDLCYSRGAYWYMNGT